MKGRKEKAGRQEGREGGNVEGGINSVDIFFYLIL
jgi:hypothetical protein